MLTIRLCLYCIMCSICCGLMPVQDKIHILGGECRRVADVVLNEFSIYIPMVLVVHIFFFARRLPVNMLKIQNWSRIRVKCLVSWWIGLRGGPKGRKESYVPGIPVRQWSSSWMFSRTILKHCVNACEVELIEIDCMFPQILFEVFQYFIFHDAEFWC